LLAGGQAESDQQMGLAGAGLAEQHHRLAGVEVGARGQRGELGGLDAGQGVEVELAEPLESWEAGFGDPSGAAAFAAVVDLGGEDLGEEHQVGLALPGGDLGQPGCLGADGGQPQFVGGGADRGLGGLVAACAHRSLPVSSWS